jgi:hypothetical protein
MWDRGSKATAATEPLTQWILTSNCGSTFFRYRCDSMYLNGFPRLDGLDCQCGNRWRTDARQLGHFLKVPLLDADWPMQRLLEMP